MLSSSYGIPDKTSASTTEPQPKEWSSYYTQKAASDPFGLIGEQGAQAKASASGFTPRVTYRFYNTANGVHFYTMSEQERAWVQANLPHFTFEGQGFFAVSTSAASVRPVYRFYNTRSGAHFYTINPDERDQVIANLSAVFNYEGIAWYGSTVGGPGWFPIYRFFNTTTGTHFYTAAPTERDSVIKTLPSFNYEGIAYYVRLNGSLDITLTGVDANQNGVRDSSEQTLAILAPAATIANNLPAMAEYERILNEPLPTTRAQALARYQAISCKELAAGNDLFESGSFGMRDLVFDTDARLGRYKEFVKVMGYGYMASELGGCNAGKTSNVVRKVVSLGSGFRTNTDLRTRLVFVNGIMNSTSAAVINTRSLLDAVGYDVNSDEFDYDHLYNPTEHAGSNFQNDNEEMMIQSQFSLDARQQIGKTFREVNENNVDKLAYYGALGRTYVDIDLDQIPFLARPFVDEIVVRSTQFANYIGAYISQSPQHRIILVPHSQGNFYVEAAVAILVARVADGALPGKTVADLQRQINVIGVAPVAASTWSSSYFSSDMDYTVHRLLELDTPSGYDPMPPNLFLCALAPCASPTLTPNRQKTLEDAGMDVTIGPVSAGHGFIEAYLNPRLFPGTNTDFGKALPNYSVRQVVGSMVREAVSPPQMLSVSPLVAPTGVWTTFTVVGANLPSDVRLQPYLAGNCQEPVYRSATELRQACAPSPGYSSMVLELKGKTVMGVQKTLATQTIQVQPVSPTVTSFSPSTAVLNQATVFTVSGTYLPSTTVFAIADAECQAPRNHFTGRDVQESGFEQICIPRGTTGAKAVTIKTNTTANGGVVIDSSRSISVMPGTPAPSTGFSLVGNYSKEECVKDNATGLIWEGKTASGLRAGNNVYTNYDSAYYGTPVQMTAATNSYGYVAYVNDIHLCGFTDGRWRLPTVDELVTLLVNGGNPAQDLDPAWFPNTSIGRYWSSRPYGGVSYLAWFVYTSHLYLSHLSPYYGSRDDRYAVRLVRASQ